MGAELADKPGEHVLASLEVLLQDEPTSARDNVSGAPRVASVRPQQCAGRSPQAGQRLAC